MPPRWAEELGRSHLKYSPGEIGKPISPLIKTTPSLNPSQEALPSSPHPPGIPGAAQIPPPGFGAGSDRPALSPSPCRARQAPPVQERGLHEPALQGEVAVQRVRHRAALLQEPRARVPRVSAALGGWGAGQGALGSTLPGLTGDVSPPAGLSPSLSSGWMRTRRCRGISCTERWRGTRRTG